MPIEVNTKIGIVSRACILIGEAPVNSLDEDRYAVTVGANLFDLVYEAELQSNRWRFSVKKGPLSQLTAAPLNQWRYAYQLPSDMLLPLHVYPPVPYEIYADRLYTDASSVEMDYQFKPEVSKLPAHFVLLLTYALARDMVKSVTESDNGFKILDAKYAMQRQRSLFADAQGRPSTPIVNVPFVDVR